MALVAESLLCFVLLDCMLPRWPFERVHGLVVKPVPRKRIRKPVDLRGEEVDRVVRAVAFATRFYYRRREDCLPRSLTLCRLLRRRGLNAQVCLGVKQFPFRAHAWVEFEGEVIGDSPERVSSFQALAEIHPPETR